MKTEELAKARLTYLNEVVERYNSGNRAKRDGSCYYSHSHNGGCAIGHKLPVKVAEKLDNYAEGGYANGSVVSSPEIFAIVQKECPSLAAMGRDFLREIQCLHDNDSYWNENGISEFGKNTVNAIKYNYKLP